MADTPSSQGDGTVELQVLAATSHVLAGTSNSVDILAKVISGKQQEMKTKTRNPLNLAIVLDKSGSMASGNKLENAKLAILQVIQQLGDKDILHLVSYDTNVYTVFANKDCAATTNYADLEKQVNEIESGSSTNLWGGLDRGVELLIKNKPEGYHHRMFLFSDGLVNAGVTDKGLITRNVSDVYEKHGIQVSAFGLGDDFDEALMKGIADKGIGAYFFIENAKAIPIFVGAALKFLQLLVGTGAVLKARGMNSGIMKKFYGDHDKIKGALLGDLNAENTRTVLLQVEVSPQRGVVSVQDILECELTYTRDVNGVPKEIVVKKTVSVIATDDSVAVETNKNMEVHVSSILQKLVKLDKKLAEKMEGNNKDAAMDILREEITLLESVVEVDKNQFNNRNKVDHLLRQTKENLEKLKKEGVTKQQVKEVHHRGYTVERGDECYFDLYG